MLVMGQNTQILLVEDNPVIRGMLLESISQQTGVEAFGSAAEALRRAEMVIPDLIISDYRMPGLNGLDLLDKLRLSFPQIAVVLLASHADIIGPLAGSSAMVEDFIEKPFFLEEAMVRI